MKAPVLILGSEPRIAIPIARSLYTQGISVDVASLSASEPVLRSRAVSRFIRLPAANSAVENESSGFVEKLTHLIAERRYDMLIPATDAALAALCDHSACLRELVSLACPAPEVVQNVLNKTSTLAIASKAGIRVPETYRVSSLAALDALAHELRFPVVAKPYHKSGETDFKVRYFRGYEALRHAFADDDDFGGKVLLQEFAPGDGVGIEVLMHNGKQVTIFQHRRLKEVPASGGAAAVAIAERLQPMLVDQALALLHALEWEGIAMVEFRYDREQGQSSLMEVNGRYWGTLALAIQSGLDFPWYEWQIAHGEKPTPPPNYTVGNRWRWTSGYVRRWHGLAKSSARKALRTPAALKELIPSLSDLGARDALWSATDPLPAFSDTLRQTRNLLGFDAASALRKLGFRDRKQPPSPIKATASVQRPAEKSDLGA
jgi:predicted ATP-grasp superfamily ATP-dependent carboligase